MSGHEQHFEHAQGLGAGLVRCDVCQGVVSERAAVCPHCGDPRRYGWSPSLLPGPRTPSERLLVVVLAFPLTMLAMYLFPGYAPIIALLAAALVLWLLIRRRSGPPATSPPDSRGT